MKSSIFNLPITVLLPQIAATCHFVASVPSSLWALLARGGRGNLACAADVAPPPISTLSLIRRSSAIVMTRENAKTKADRPHLRNRIINSSALLQMTHNHIETTASVFATYFAKYAKKRAAAIVCMEMNGRLCLANQRSRLLMKKEVNFAGIMKALEYRQLGG
jgi:hypothetical protein